MPTLLQINCTANWGSTGRIAEQIGQYVMSKGWDSYIAYGRMMNPSKSKLIRVGSLFNPYEHYAENLLFDNEGLASRLATKQFLREVNRIKPDVVHLHNIHDHFLNYPFLFSYLCEADIPVVWTLHDCWGITGHCAHFDYVECQKWMSECGDCPQTHSLLGVHLIDNSRRNFRKKKSSFTSVENLTIVTVSEWLTGKVEQSFLEEKKIMVIPNGVDVQMFRPTPSIEIRKKYGIGSGRFLLAVASIWSERKGLKDYIRLASLLGEEVRLVLVGLSAKQAKNLPHNIITVPRTQKVEELAQLYTEASIVLNLSYEETFGLTTIEGYACGTPAIVYDRTASPELVAEGTGLVVQAGDVEGVNTAINIILSSGESEYSSRCRELAEEKYDKEKSFQAYIDLYDSLFEDSRRGGVIAYKSLYYKGYCLLSSDGRVAA